MSEVTLLNVAKDNYGNSPLFLDEQGVGLADTVHVQYPSIKKLYKKMKQLDWDENEFNFSSCIEDFRHCDQSTYDMMIKTLAFQWEADSIASRISPIVGAIVTNTELWGAWSRVSENEFLHAATYSEIVRNSFKDPTDILEEITKVQESFSRLSTIHHMLDKIAKAAHRYAAGDIPADDELYDLCFMFPVTMLILERVQFMSSFAVTFGICETGYFTPIGKAVQKICQDELEVHCELDKEVIRIELKTERGQRAFERNRNLIIKMLHEVRMSEHEWADYLFDDGRSMTGVTCDLLKKWSDFNLASVVNFFGVQDDFGVKLPKGNPLKFMDDWVDISAIQPSPQEEDNGQYKVNAVVSDDDGVVFDF